MAAKRKNRAMDEFMEAIRRLPPPVPCFSNGATCPWCGELHETITFGDNNCNSCGRYFVFGYPDWHIGKDPVSHVPFPHRLFEELGGRAQLLPMWKPNDTLKAIYHQLAEEETGIPSDLSRPN